jgi:hypothetical protein
VTVTNRAAITDPREVAQLPRALHGYRGHPVVEAALKLAPLVFVRPGELRAAEWAEIDLGAAEWRIAAHRMKMRQQHLVPLADQALAILRDIKPLTGRGRYVFPSPRAAERPSYRRRPRSIISRLGARSQSEFVSSLRTYLALFCTSCAGNAEKLRRFPEAIRISSRGYPPTGAAQKRQAASASRTPPTIVRRHAWHSASDG